MVLGQVIVIIQVWRGVITLFGLRMSVCSTFGLKPCWEMFLLILNYLMICNFVLSSVQISLISEGIILLQQDCNIFLVMEMHLLQTIDLIHGSLKIILHIIKKLQGIILSVLCWDYPGSTLIGSQVWQVQKVLMMYILNLIILDLGELH